MHKMGGGQHTVLLRTLKRTCLGLQDHNWIGVGNVGPCLRLFSYRRHGYSLYFLNATKQDTCNIYQRKKKKEDTEKQPRVQRVSHFVQL